MNTPMNSSSVSVLLSEGLRHHQSRRFAEARRLYQQALDREPENAEALQLLGVLAKQEGDNPQAVELLGKAAALNSESPDVHNNLGVVLTQTGRLNEAEASFHKALALREDATAYFNLALVLQKLDSRDAAEAACRRAVELKPDWPEALLELACLCRRAGRYPDAEKFFRRAIELRPRWAEARSEFALLLDVSGRIDEALRELEHATELVPGHLHALCNKGLLLLGMNRASAAAAVFREACGHAGLAVPSHAYDDWERPREATGDGIAVIIHPLTDDAYGTMRVSQQQFVRSARKMGYRAIEVHSNAIRTGHVTPQWLNTHDVSRFVTIGVNRFLPEILTLYKGMNRPGCRWIQVLGSSPWAGASRARLTIPDVAAERQTVMLCDEDAVEYTAQVYRTISRVAVFKTFYFNEFLNRERARRPVNARSIRLLYVGSHQDPNVIRQRWLADKRHAALCDEIAEAACATFTRPLWMLARDKVEQRGLDPAWVDGPGGALLEHIGRYATAHNKNRVLQRLSRYPCCFISSAKAPPWPVHAQARWIPKLPFPLLLDLLHDTGSTVSCLPSHQTGVVSERIPNAMVRGTLVIGAANNVVQRTFRAGIDMLAFNVALDALDAHVERVFSRDPDLQTVVENAREIVELRFQPERNVAETLQNIR